MDESHLQMLADGARIAGVPLDTAQRELFRLYIDELLLWNRRYNLVAAADPEEIVVRHVLDSLAVVPLLPRRDGLLLDIGSGAGFPGIPLKIACPSLEVRLLEASRKKSSFLKRVAGILNLEGIGVLWERTEDCLRRDGVAGSFDMVISRAVLPLLRFAEIGSPFLRPGGYLVVMAGPATDSRISPPEKAGLSPISIHEYRLPLSGDRRKIFLYKKSMQIK
ncbi:MAG: 16S rRNA (guanine(527)-N(7))-methyltransferase RsmG [Syntrophaceae bacterium]|nr:16S rRNA (guanine(527)-N(7))-methyltransferase RsmG [Syntrophaceae bacterium]